MGYYTQYTIVIDDKNMDSDRKDAVMERIYQISGYYAREFCEPIKWYNHKEHMQTVSAEFPDVRMTVYGAGEEAGDLWVLYCLGGAVQYHQAIIAYPDPPWGAA